MSARSRRTPRRAELSQHFLRGGALPGSIVQQAGISPTDLVVEIGPGRGALTTPLARRCARLVAVELDARLAQGLSERFRLIDHVSIVQGDFLRFGLPSQPYKVVGNIPFSRTAEIMRRLTRDPAPLRDAYLVVQREAGHRYCGGPYAQESLMSLTLKPYWQVEILRQFRRSDFDPAPGVDTVLLWLARRDRPLLDGGQASRFRQFVESCFGQGGNSITRCLSSAFSWKEVRRLSADLRFDREAPPSHLSFDQWLGLFRFHDLK